MEGETPQDDQGVRLPAVVHKEPARRDRGTWPTLSKPQIYDVGGEARENQLGLERVPAKKEKLHPASRTFVLVSAVNTICGASRVALYSFFRPRLSVYIYIERHEAYVHVTKVQQRREKHRPSPSNSLLFYGFIHSVTRTRAFMMRYACLLRQYRRSAELDILLYVRCCIALSCCKGSSFVSIRFI